MAREEDRARFLRLRPRGRRSSRLIDIALAIVVRGDTVLVARRADDQHLPGAWEFPGGKVEDGEEPQAAALRELREETRLIASRAEPLVVFTHEYPDRHLRIHAYLVRGAEGEPATDRNQPWGWIRIPFLRDSEMPDANRTILAALRRRMAETGHDG